MSSTESGYFILQSLVFSATSEVPLDTDGAQDNSNPDVGLTGGGCVCSI